MNDDPISFWVSDGIAWARPSGECADLMATRLKEATKELMRRGHRDFVVDLEDCTGMNDTFMGTLTGTALRLRELKQGKLRLVHCPSDIEDFLRNLGLDQLMEIVEDEIV